MSDTLITTGGTRCRVISRDLATEQGWWQLTTPIAISREHDIVASIAASLAAGTGYEWAITIKPWTGTDCATFWRTNPHTYDATELALNRSMTNPLGEEEEGEEP